MRVLIIGTAGSGKSYLAEKMKSKRLNAVDASNPKYRLTKFIDVNGRKVKYVGGKEWWSNHSYMYDLTRLERLLKGNDNIYLFGDLRIKDDLKIAKFFDKTFYLKLPKQIIRERLVNRKGNPFGKQQGELEGILASKIKEDRMARKAGLTIIDATLPVGEIIKIITS